MNSIFFLLLPSVRWVVEAHHGRLKRWIYFYNRQANSFIEMEHDALYVLCAALNAFAAKLATNKPADEKIAKIMLERAQDKVKHSDPDF